MCVGNDGMEWCLWPETRMPSPTCGGGTGRDLSKFTKYSQQGRLATAPRVIAFV